MSDMGDMFRDLRAHRQAKRANNRALGVKFLRERGYQFKTRNGGAHLIVAADGGWTVDFWPGTGKWIARADGGTTIHGRGIAHLMRDFPPAVAA